MRWIVDSAVAIY